MAVGTGEAGGQLPPIFCQPKKQYEFKNNDIYISVQQQV